MMDAGTEVTECDLTEKLLAKRVEVIAEEKLKDKLWIENKKIPRIHYKQDLTAVNKSVYQTVKKDQSGPPPPARFTRFSNFGVNIISQAFIGHVGSTELAGYALTFSVLMTFTIGILMGMASALETLCGQAYGAKQYRMMGIYLQRSWLVLLMSAILITPAFIFAAPILKALGQEETISDMAGNIAYWFIPVIFSYVVSYTCQMFLQTQSKNKIIVYLASFSLPFHSFLSWLLTMKFKFGVKGVMMSTILAFWIPNVGNLVYIFGGSCRETWHGFSVLAFKDLWPVIKLSLSSGVMLCLEVWYNSVLILLTGNLVNAEIAIDALTICLSLNGWVMMVSNGFLAAAGVRVSNELGRGSSKAAKFSILNIVMISFSMGLVLFLSFLIFRERIPYIFTNSSEVAAAVVDLSPLLACSILLNSIQPVLSGVAVGGGWQSTVAYVNIVCYYIVGVPVGAILGYVANLQVKGVWIGMLIGTFVQTIVLIIITYRTDWDKQVNIAQRRLNKWLIEPDQPRANEHDV